MILCEGTPPFPQGEPHLDGPGSTIAMTDESGKVRNRYGYDEYGNPTNATSEQIFDRYTFTGHNGLGLQLWSR